MPTPYSGQEAAICSVILMQLTPKIAYVKNKKLVI